MGEGRADGNSRCDGKGTVSSSIASTCIDDVKDV